MASGASLIEPLKLLGSRWRAVTRRARWRSASAALAGCLIVGLLCARQGTPAARIVAAFAVLAGLTFGVAWRVRVVHSSLDPQRILRGLVRRADRQRADRALRALSLLATSGAGRSDGTSLELAGVHVARALSDIPSESILERAGSSAARAAGLALFVGLGLAAAVFGNAWSLVEGADILFAHGGVAPLPLTWLDGVEVMIRPPEYLHQDPIREIARSPLVLPNGSVVTLRGTPIRAGHRLFLTDQTTEIPFVDDGAGAVVARYTLATSATLRVVARFGDVVIREPESLPLTSLADRPPLVHLEGAPKAVALIAATDDIPIKYEVTDDHGLREIQLVFRSGTREEHRVLERIDGEMTVERGGQVLRLRDPFLAQSHLPVAVTVEAKDNDPLTGPKWGASASITIIPPDVAAAQASRLEALRRVRDAAVDSLAWRLQTLQTEMPRAVAMRDAFVHEERKREAEDDRVIEEALATSFGGIRVPPRIRAVLTGQRQALRKATIAAGAASVSPAASATVVEASERFALVVDAVVRGMGARDSRDAAKELADVADDLALAARQMRDDAAETRSRGTQRMDAAVMVLRGGGRWLPRLGALGRDLGEIVESYMRRVDRSREAHDLAHAELSARDLAARLRQPDPSFGVRGGTRRAGGESGGAQNSPSDGDDADPPDEVEQAFEQAVQDLDRLAQEHAGEIGRTEQALAGSANDDERRLVQNEAKRHAEVVREAAGRLPPVGRGSDSWTSKASAARDLAEQMARSLEEGRPGDAVESGHSAVGALEEAKKIIQRGGWMDDASGDRQRLVDDARRKLEAESRWAEGQRSELKKRAEERARGQLEQNGQEEERLADQARSVGQKGRASGLLPEKAAESIDDAEKAARQAAEALKHGDAERGLERQRDAQRSLEAARHQLQGEDDELPGRASAAEGRVPAPSSVVIPNAKEHKGPEDFRRRVVHGLGQPGAGAVKDAVQRYAEGLLR